MIVITISEIGRERDPNPVVYKVSGFRGKWSRFEDAARLAQIMLEPGMTVRFYTKTCRHNKQHQPVTIWSLHIESTNNNE